MTSRNRNLLRLLVAAAILSAAGPALAAVKVTRLRCEWQTDPIAIDARKPRLSWVLESGERGQKQTAYQVMVHAADGVAWDSGKVASDQSVNVEYGGRPLRSGERLEWQVTVWDKDGNPAKSPRASWQMGLLDPADWKEARWIGRKANLVEEPPPLEPQATRWIWYPEGDPINSTPPGHRAFRKTIDLPAADGVRQAYFFAACDGRCKVLVNGAEAGQVGGPNAFVPIDAKPHLRPGANVIEVHARNGGDAGGVVGQLAVLRTSGPLRVNTDKSWQTAKMDSGPPKDWVAAREVGRVGEGKFWQALKGARVIAPRTEPPAYLRRELELAAKPKRARLHVTALGLYEVSINGKRVGDESFAPGWTDYESRLQYQTYDVTRQLAKGANAVGAILADGWYTGWIGWGKKRHNYGIYPLRLRALLEVEYDGGRRESFVTDESWKAAPVGAGPILAADFFEGESYDARKEMAGWDRPGFADAAWQPVNVAAAEKRRLVAAPGGAVRVTEELRPRAITQPAPGTYVFDLGQNMVGWVRLRVRGPAGSTIRLRHAEMLNPDGTVYLENLRGAPSVDSYVLAGRGEEIWEPRFTYHGFRYVEVTGLAGKPTKATVTGRVAHSEIPRTGRLSTSSPMLNQLEKNIDWGQRGNFVSVPTDCPQRDERIGWTGDAQIFARTACLFRDVAPFFTKWVRDLADAQTPEGAFPDFAPRPPDAANNGAPAWGDAGVIVPWVIYGCYGDRRLLEEHYPHMVRWVEFLAKNNPDHIWKERRGSDYGDWLSIQADTDKTVIATAFFAWSARLVARAAEALGKSEDARKYEALFGAIKGAFNKAFVSPDGQVKSATQTAHALALRFDLLPPELRPKTAALLVADIEKRGGRLSTGFVGVAHLLPALSETGHWDTAYKLLLNETFPSWGYSIKHGATTVWERWDGWTHDKGFQNPGMNSFNHYAFGAVAEWMYANVAGLDNAAPGWKQLRFRPRPGGGLTRAEASLDTVYGRAASRWSLDKGKLRLEVTLPANTSGEVHVPGTPAGAPPAGATRVRDEDGAVVYRVESGRYAFTSAL